MLCAGSAAGQPAEPAAIRLYDKPPAAAANPERTDVRNGLRVVRNVSDPTLTAFLPDPAKATGTAVIVAPGGAFMLLSYDSEGALVARRLAEHGVAAFVLKYRLEPTPADPAAFAAVVMRRLSEARNTAVASGGTSPFTTEDQATADGAEALRLVRRRAAEWKIDPHRVGFLGFSAGAILTTNLATADDPATRPDFVGVIYGALRKPVPADAPPAFFATASDDPLLGKAAVPMVEAWHVAKRPAELHLYERGGHGFGLVPKGSSSDHWFDEFLWWMDGRGLLKGATQ
ncbi:MAG TPA: alpha/beta hydrolase [Phenylobacterium sp.]|nr:alpha/beta hydrolase [Phenylobacterium sp.]